MNDGKTGLNTHGPHHGVQLIPPRWLNANQGAAGSLGMVPKGLKYITIRLFCCILGHLENVLIQNSDMAPVCSIRVLVLCDTFVLHSDLFDPTTAIFGLIFRVYS